MNKLLINIAVKINIYIVKLLMYTLFWNCVIVYFNYLYKCFRLDII